MNSFKVLIESEIVYDSQSPLPLEKGTEIDVIENEKLILKKVEQI